MSEKAPTCKDCGQPMFVVGTLAGTVEMGKLDDNGRWIKTGVKSPKLYQCPECKDVKID